MRKKQPCDTDMEEHLRNQELHLLAQIQFLQEDIENHYRVIAVLLEALGGTYTISRKQLVEMDWNPQVYRQDNYDGSVTLAVVKERT